MKFDLIGPVVSEMMMFENVDKDETWVNLDQGQTMTLTSDTCISSCIHHTKYNIIDCNSFQEIHYLGVFLYKSIRTKFDLCIKRSKVNRGHHLNKLGSNLSAQCYIPSFNDLGHSVLKKKFLKVFTIHGHAGHLGHVTRSEDHLNKLCSPSHRSSIWNLTLIGPVVSEEKTFKECGDYNGRRRPTYTIS